MKFISILTLVMSFSASAQVSSDIENLLRSIRQEASATSDSRILMRVKMNLERTLEILTGTNPDPGPRPTPRSNLSCVARDNDGRDPWVLGIKDPVTLNTTKIPNSNVGSLENCNLAKTSAVFVGNSVFACISRDNDGKEPFSVAQFKNNQFVRNINNIGSLNDCVTSLQNAIRSYEAIAFCATKDNDGRGPWVEMSVVETTGQIRTAGTYNNLNDCLSSQKKK